MNENNILYTQAKQTSAIVHKISHFNPLKNYATDIRLLSLQISHETFYITANGFCNIGLKTLGSVRIGFVEVDSSEYERFKLIFLDCKNLHSVFNHHYTIQPEPLI